MADRMSNIAGLFKEGRTRIIVISTLVILLIAVIVGIMSIRGRVSGEDVGTGVSRAPGNIQSVPFEAPSEEYAKLQEQQNEQVAKQAEEAGTASIPTIIRASQDQGEAPANADYGVGFTALSREQTDAGTFTAKSFGTQQCMQYAGNPVCNVNGCIIGYVGSDGKVRSTINSKIIGSINSDGTARDLSGKPLGKVCNSEGISNKADETGVPGVPQGTPVYDENGNLIGYVGADGKVRDANGNIIGTVGPDGLIRDANGKIIGRAGSIIPGTPVYDDNGNIIGYVGADGKVRDANGNVIGTVGPDGLVRDANGKVIGSLGTPVYDENGNLIGFAGPDGKVRDKDGNNIGTVGPDGVARDLNGKIIGKAGAINPGTPVYDANGNIIGYVGPDGKVRDANGNVIGTIGVDGLVRDENGNVVGSIKKPTSTAATTNLGTPVYDANGKLIGYVGPDGKVRDANGNIIGTVGADGSIKDANGNVIGSVNQPTAAQQTQADAEALAAQRRLMLQQDQRYQQLVQQRQQGMMQQVNQLLGAWVSPVQQMVTGTVADQGQDGQGQATGASSAQSPISSSAASNPVFIKAGSVYYGVINTAINSDEPGPIMATIVNGPYKGGKLLGILTNQGKAVMLTFNTLTLDSFPESISINAVAIDQNTARTALSTYTNNHYLLRYGSMFAASFIQGYGQAFSQSGSTTASNGLTTISSTPNLTPQAKFFVALGNVGNSFSQQVNTIFNTPPTVYVASGTPVGVLFLGDVQLPGMGGAQAQPPALPNSSATSTTTKTTTTVTAPATTAPMPADIAQTITQTKSTS